MLVYDKKVPKHFRRIAIVTGVLPIRDSQIRGATVRIKKTNIIFKRPVNKFLPIENNMKTLTKQESKGNEG